MQQPHEKMMGTIYTAREHWAAEGDKDGTREGEDGLEPLLPGNQA